MSGTMINFRLREDSVATLDAAARTLGVDRSTFIRDAINERLGRMGSGAVVSIQGTRGKAKTQQKHEMPFAECPKSDACQIVRLPTGVKACQACKVRMA